MKKLPPKLAHKILLSFLRDDLAEDVSGDLEERFFLNLKTSSLLSAQIDYWRQVLLYVRPFAIRKLSYQTINSSPMIRSYFKTALRSMVKNKMFAVINITGLAIGMAVTMVLSLWIWDELSFNKVHRHHEKIAQVIHNVTNNGEVVTWTSVPYPLAEEIRKNYGTDFERVVMTTGGYPVMLTVNNKKFSKVVMYAEPGFFGMLSLKILSGDVKSSTDPSSVFLSASAAKALFGDSDPLNQILKIDDTFTVHVAGTYEDITERSEFAGLELIVPWETYYGDPNGIKTFEDPWRPNSFELYVQLTGKADFTGASERIKDAELRKISPALAKKKPALFLHPMDQWHLYSEFKNGKNVGGGIQYVWLFGIIAAFVLLMACVNFMNLTTSKSEQRSKEIGIRKSIGSLRSQLMSQFVSESVMTSLISLLIALLVVTLSLPAFNLLANKHISIDWSNPVFWLVVLGFCFITGLIAGSYPAFYLSSIDPNKALKGSYKAGTGAGIFRKGLVVMQFTISVVLIVGTVTVYRQIQYAKNRPVGYDKNALVSVRDSGPELHKHFEVLKNDLIKSGSVVALSESYVPPTSTAGSTSRLDWKGKDPNLSVDFNFFGGSTDYGKTVAWEITAGRDFRSDILSDSTAIILNESAVNYMSLKDPVGETVRWGKQQMTVIGVVRNMLFGSPYEAVRPTLYALEKGQAGFFIIRLNQEKGLTESLAAVERIFKNYAPDMPFNYRFADVEFAKKFAKEDRVGKLSTMFTTLAIFISCLGIFGLSSFVAEQRTKEIGVRKVLGASVFNLWRMLCRDFVLLVVVSCIIAVPIAYYSISSWLMNYSYRAPFPWWMLGSAGLVTLVITLITVSYHALKAANMKPVKSLRSE